MHQLDMHQLVVSAIILPQEKNIQYTGIVKHSTGLDPFLGERDFYHQINEIGGTAQHMYLLSARDIECGDLISDGKSLFQVGDVLADEYIGLYKVEASSDSSINKPIIPVDFIELMINMPNRVNNRLFISFDGNFLDGNKSKVVTNAFGEVIFLIPCDNPITQKAAKDFSMEKTLDMPNGMMKFATRHAIEESFIAGAEWKEKEFNDIKSNNND
jgi:hypothetical protein